MVALYNLAIACYGLAIRAASLFNAKARAWLHGRRKLFRHLEQAVDHQRPWIWIHVASLGEFEQGRPVIERLRSAYPDHGILLSFFSPSGYTVRKDYPHADHVTYLPLDTHANARRWVRKVRPALAIFVKYEIWYHYLRALDRARVPTLLISAQLRAGQFYFAWYGRFMRRRLAGLTRIFTTGTEQTQFLNEAGLRNAETAGDTRIDRVITIARDTRDFSTVGQALGPGAEILVAGSTWPADEQILIPWIRETATKAIIAPHENSEERIQALTRQLGPAVLRLSASRDAQRPADIVIVDTMGDLAHLYALGAIAYVGGGFGPGIHNILEPLAHGLPVIFGPNYDRFAEAHDLISLGVARSVQDPDTLRQAIAHFREAETPAFVATRAQTYLARHQGATERIYAYIRDEQLLDHGLAK
ncbi:MAG: glycosyltransferase N-terminal domain-containing protein [Saprospiraceae bacterium]|nr:glycosyltransferase N-terminal domain-containing protein [Saprospiraceae bacterium]